MQNDDNQRPRASTWAYLPGDSPHDLEGNRTQAVAWLGRSCLHIKRMAIFLGEGQLFHDKAASTGSRLLRVYRFFATEERIDPPYPSQYGIAGVYVHVLLKKHSPLVRIGSFVSDAIWKLFHILRTWRRGKDLALEINVYSASDCEHWFKNLQVSSDTCPLEGDDEDAMRDVSRSQSSYHDPQHDWIGGQRVNNPPRSAAVRLFRPIRLVFREALPRVEAVTHLVIRRQLRRCISPFGLSMPLSRLDRLERITYEPWAPYNSCREFLDRGR
jgi:hypothetical protein